MYARHGRGAPAGGVRLACALAGVVAILVAPAPARGDQSADQTGPAPARATQPPGDEPDPCADFLRILEAPSTTRDPLLRSEYPGATVDVTDTAWFLANDRDSGKSCRTALETGQATALSAALDDEYAAAKKTGKIFSPLSPFFALICSLHPNVDWAVPWIIEGVAEAPECLAGLYELSGRPDAANAIDRVVAKFPDVTGRMYVSSARLSRGVRRVLAPKLGDTYRARVDWYGAFWQVVCGETNGAPAALAGDCSRFRPTKEGWAGEERGDVAFRVVRRGLIVLPAAGVVALDAVLRHDESGHVIAAAAAGAGGAVAGAWLGATLAGAAQGGSGGGGGAHYGDPIGMFVGIATGIAGAVASSVLTYRLTADAPNARVGVTAAGMAIVSGWVISLSWD